MAKEVQGPQPTHGSEAFFCDPEKLMQLAKPLRGQVRLAYVSDKKWTATVLSGGAGMSYRSG